MTIEFDRPYGSNLERDLLDKMPLLSSFDLFITCSLFSLTSNERKPMDVKTFQSITWQKFNPIVCFNDTEAESSAICSLPFKSNYVRKFLDREEKVFN